ncbi:MAG TPA: hypothetical protein VGJ22_01945, partial [Anaerolineales bacterium]
ALAVRDTTYPEPTRRRASLEHLVMSRRLVINANPTHLSLVQIADRESQYRADDQPARCDDDQALK